MPEICIEGCPQRSFDTHGQLATFFLARNLRPFLSCLGEANGNCLLAALGLSFFSTALGPFLSLFDRLSDFAVDLFTVFCHSVPLSNDMEITFKASPARATFRLLLFAHFSQNFLHWREVESAIRSSQRIFS